MQKLLEETLLCDLSLQSEAQQYGQKWSSIENHLKKIITKDNQLNNKKSPKKIILSLNKTNKIQNCSDKLSPKNHKDLLKLSAKSKIQKSTQNQIKVLSNNYSQDFQSQSQNISYENLLQKSTLQQKNIDTILQENQQKQFITQGSQTYQAINRLKFLSIKKKSQNVSLKNQLPANFEKINNFKYLQKNGKKSSFSSFSHSYPFENQCNNKKMNVDNDELSKLKQNYQKNLNSALQQIKEKIDHRFQIQKSENELIIRKKQNKDENTQDKKIMQVKSNSAKSLRQKSILLPLLEIGGSHIINERVLTSRINKVFSFSQSKKSSQSKSRFHIKNQMASSLDRKRVMSINLILNKKKPLTQSSVSRQVFQEINLQNKQQKGIRKVKISEFVRGKFQLNGEEDLKENKQCLILNRNVGSRSCFLKGNEFVSCGYFIEKEGKRQSSVSVDEQLSKKYNLFSNKNQQKYQKPILFSSLKKQIGKGRTLSKGKQNTNRKTNFKEGKNISFLKFQLHKQQPKLVILKR